MPNLKLQICFQKIGKGLDEAPPFGDSLSVDILLREAETILSQDVEGLGARSASRIWAFLSKFVMLDRLSKVLGAAEVYPGLPVPKKMCSSDYIGTGAKVICFLL
jgi:hypothetical protein